MTDTERITLIRLKSELTAAIAAVDKLPDVTSHREKEAVKALRAMLWLSRADLAELLVVPVPPTPIPPPPEPPKILSFGPAKSPIQSGEIVRLSWTAINATSFKLLGNGASVSLSAGATWYNVAPLTTTIYTLTAYGTEGQAQSMAVVSVLPVPVPEPPPAPVPTPIPPTPTPLPQEFKWLGKVAERVGPGYGMLSSDGELDGTFLYQPGRSGTLHELRICSGLNDWCTGGPFTNRWVLGVSVSGKDGPLVNAIGGAVNLVVTPETQLHLFAADSGSAFAKSGEQYDLLIVWTDGQMQQLSCFGGDSPAPVPPPPPVPPTPLPPVPPWPLPTPTPPTPIGELLGPGGDRFLSWATNQPDSVTVTPGTSVDWTGEQVGGRTVLIAGDVTVGSPD